MDIGVCATVLNGRPYRLSCIDGEVAAAPASRPEFKGTVSTVATSRFWDDEAHAILNKYWIKRKWTDPSARTRFETLGSQPPYHYMDSGTIFTSTGFHFGQAMRAI